MLSGGIIVCTTGGDVVGRYYIFVKTALLILLKGFTSILLLKFSLPVVDVSLSIGRSMLEWRLRIGNWDCRSTLAIMRYFTYNGDLPFYLAFVIVVRDL